MRIFTVVIEEDVSDENRYIEALTIRLDGNCAHITDGGTDYEIHHHGDFTNPSIYHAMYILRDYIDAFPEKWMSEPQD